MYGEYIEIDGRQVFILCCPDTPQADKERQAREQIAREQEAGSDEVVLAPST